MYSVSPTQTELYHLRLLLLTVKGATSFDKLKTVNEEICQTFSRNPTRVRILSLDHWDCSHKETDGSVPLRF